MRKILGIMGLVLLPILAHAAQNTLTWVDNSTNETSFKVERTTASSVANCATAGGFTQIATVGPDIVTYVDSSVNEGTTYCYRVRASNTAGDSAYSNIAGRLVPFTIPAAPANLQVGP